MRAKNTISRRILLRRAALASAGAFVAACAQPQATEVPAVAPTPAVSEPTVAPAAVPPTAVPEAVTISVLIAPEAEYGEITPETPLWKYYSEVFGYKFEVMQVPWDALGQQVSLKVASGDMPTIMIVKSPQDSGLSPLAFVNKYGAEGAFVRLDEFIDAGKMPNLTAWRDQYPALGIRMVAPDGHVYAAVQGFFSSGYPALLLRTDLLEQCGFIKDRNSPPPSRDIITTVDDLYNALDCIKQAMGGAPVLGNRFGPAKAIASWSAFFGTSSGAYYNYATKQFEMAPLMQRFRVMVEFLNKLFKNGILHPDYATMGDEEIWAKWDQGELGAVADNFTFAMGRLKKLGIEGKDLPVQSLTIDGERVLWPRSSPWADRYPLVISAKASPEQIEAAVKLVDWLYTKEAAELTWFGKEGVDWQRGPDGRMLLTGNNQCVNCYLDADYVGGKAPAEDADIPSYAALGIKNSEGDLPRLVYPEYYYDDMPMLFQWYPDRDRDIMKQAEAAGSLTDPLLPLTHTSEEQETLAELGAPMDTYVMEETQKFIESQRPLTDDEWKKFTAKVEELGAKQIVDIKNAALGRIK